MSWLDAIKKSLGRAATAQEPMPPQPVRPAEPEVELRAPEIAPLELMAEWPEGAAASWLLLDCREPYERVRGYIAGSLHIPMNSIPERLNELDPARDIVVYCAHGIRSYGVTGWLNQQGYRAVSLKGGIAEWQAQRGPVESGFSSRP